MVIFATLTVVLAVSGAFVTATIFVALVVLLASQLRLVRSGRNPWWTRARFDGR